MFDVSFNVKDFVRSCWAALFSGLTAFFMASTGFGPISNFQDAKAAGYAGLVAAGVAILTALKNALLADGTNLKG